MRRSLDGPDGVWSDVKEAAGWLGLTVPEFRTEADKFPHLLPSTRIGKGDKYHWSVLVGYSILRPLVGTPRPGDDEDEEKS